MQPFPSFSRLLPLILLLAVSATYAQNKIPKPEASRDVIVRASQKSDAGKYDQAIEELLKVNRNDTGYALAMAELAYAYLQNDQDKMVIKVCDEGIKLRSKYDFSFLNLKGKALLNSGSFEAAVAQFDKAIARYPMKFILYHNKGLALKKLEKWDDAISCFQECIQRNPYWADAHYQLGKIVGDQGRLIPCMLAWNYYLLLDPAGSKSRSVVTEMEEMSQGDYQFKKSMLVDQSKFKNDDFAEVDEIVRSKVALGKAYKSRSKLNYTITKQTQVLFEKLKYNEGDNGFFMQQYVKFFCTVYKTKNDIPFAYYSLLSMNIQDVNKWIEKNKSKVVAMAKWANIEIGKMNEYKEVIVGGNKTRLKHWYFDDHNLEATGEMNAAGKYQGEWKFYAKDGYLTAEGKFNSAGEKDGLWTWYHFNGIVAEKTNFVNGKREGTMELFFENGVMSHRVTYKNNVQDGKREEFFATGVISSEAGWLTGKKEGKGIVFHNNGKIRYNLSYKLDELDGELTEFYPNGKLALKIIFIAGKKEGKSEAWHPNGEKRSVGEYKNDLESGTWTYYHDNGKKKEVISYDESGKFTGEWMTWHKNGSQKDIGIYTKGKISGIHKEYNTKGEHVGEYEYKNDDVTAFKCLDGKGNIVSKGERSGRKFIASYKHANGKPKATGEYVSGQKDGLWVYYDVYGNVSAKENYKEGMLNGKAQNFYPGGQLEVDVTYKNGLEDGYYLGYYSNGNVKSEGWYIDGAMEGEWLYYHANGKQSSTAFYHSGEQYGNLPLFHADGKKDKEFRYHYGFMDQVVVFDTSGTESSTIDFPKGSGDLIVRFPDGNTRTLIPRKNGLKEGPGKWLLPNGKSVMEGAYYNDDEQGEFRSYFENGSLLSIRNYETGSLHGKGVWYFKDGKIRVESGYHYGKTHGVRKFYYESGQLEREGNYFYGDAEGLFSYYTYDGIVYSQRLYEKDQLVSYAVIDKTGKLGPMIPYDGSSGSMVAVLPSGVKIFEQEMQNGEINGKRVWYYPSGKIYEEQNYVNDQREGKSKIYFPNGNLMQEETYFYDALDGYCKYYYDNGKVEEEGMMQMDDRIGEWKVYDKTGKHIQIKTYANGYLISVRKP